jgi:Acetyltransferase (GNAT) domain
LAADNDTIAHQLYDAASAHASTGESVYLDMPEVNLAAQKLIRELSLSPVFETARMYTGPDPVVDLSKLFGVTTFELG